MLVTLDFETYYAPKYSLTTLTTMDYVRHEKFKVQGVGIKIDDGETEYYDEHEAESAIRELDWSDVTLVCHNTPFDGYILTRYYEVIPQYYIDTAAMARALAPGQSASLKDTAIRTFPDDESMRKGDELASTKGIYDLDPELSEILGTYCIQDVDLTYALYIQMHTQMPKSEMDLIDMTCRMFCEPKLIVDLELLYKFRDETIAASLAVVEAGGVDRKVLSSNQQFAAHIESMGLVPPTKISPTTGKAIPALGKSDKAFTQMQKMYPEHQHIWDARLAAKSRINETKAQRFIDATHTDGTISAPLRYYAAHTGRFGGTEKLNMQNMPRNSPLRLALTAPKEHLIFVADLSAIEARVLAWLADETELLQLFRDGKDVYSDLAGSIYKRVINKKDDPDERFVGKVAQLGLGFGMGANRFQDTLETGAMGPPMKFSIDKAYNVVNTYRATYPGIPMLWKKLELKLANTINPNYQEEWHGLTFKNKKIYLPNDLSLHYNNLRYEQGQLVYDQRNTIKTWGGSLAENVVQALARLIVTDAMLRIQADKTLDANVVLTVHDEIILISTANNPDATMSKLIAHMCVPPAWAPDIPLDAEGGYDTSYSK